jgi:hypothetical protein
VDFVLSTLLEPTELVPEFSIVTFVVVETSPLVTCSGVVVERGDVSEATSAIGESLGTVELLTLIVADEAVLGLTGAVEVEDEVEDDDSGSATEEVLTGVGSLDATDGSGTAEVASFATEVCDVTKLVSIGAGVGASSPSLALARSIGCRSIEVSNTKTTTVENLP